MNCRTRFLTSYGRFFNFFDFRYIQIALITSATKIKCRMICSKAVFFEIAFFLNSLTIALIPYMDDVNIRPRSITAINEIRIGETNNRAGTTIANAKRSPIRNTQI